MHSRGYKRKRQTGETPGVCDASCASSRQQEEMGPGAGQASEASERSHSSVPSYVSEVTKVSEKIAHLTTRD